MDTRITLKERNSVLWNKICVVWETYKKKDYSELFILSWNNQKNLLDMITVETNLHNIQETNSLVREGDIFEMEG